MTESVARGRAEFDADTGAYNASIERSGQKTKEMVEQVARGVPLFGELIAAGGAFAVATEGIKKGWELWRQELEASERIIQQVVDKLNGVAGRSGNIGSTKEIREIVINSQGILNAEEKVGAVKAFTEANPLKSDPESITKALGQAQEASRVFGPESAPEFMRVMGGAMEAGAGQDRAGDVAAAVMESGEKGVRAFEHLLNEFLTRFPRPEQRSESMFLDFIKTARPEDFGARSVQGGLALQERLQVTGKPGSVLKSVADPTHEPSDPKLFYELQTREIKALAESNREKTTGDRAEQEQRAKALFDLDRTGHGAVFRGWSHINEFATQFSNDEHVSEYIQEMLRMAAEKAAAMPGPAKFRNEAGKDGKEP